MCIFITGYINNEAYGNEFFDLCEKFSLGHQIIKNKAEYMGRAKVSMVDGNTCRYMLITPGMCDCDTPLGKGDTNADGLGGYIGFFRAAGKLPGIKRIALLKHWYKGKIDCERIDVEQVVKIPVKKLDAEILAGIKENIFYEVVYGNNSEEDLYEKIHA